MINDIYKMMRLRSIMGRPGPDEKTGGRAKRNPGLDVSQPPMREGTDLANPQLQMFKNQIRGPEEQGDLDYFDEMERVRGNMPAMSAYKQALLNQPNRADYKPGWGSRITAALAGAAAGYGNPRAGIETAQGVLDSPYRRAMEDYSTKSEALRRGADIESDEVDSRVRSMAQARALGLKFDEFQDRQRKTDIEGFKAETERSRVKAWAADIERGNFRPINVKGGVQMVNNKNPERSYKIPGKTVAELQSDIQSRFAATGEENVKTRRSELGLRREDAVKRWAHMANQDAATRTRVDAILEKAKQGKQLNPGQQYTAIATALDSLAPDRKWKKFIDVDPVRGTAFMKEVEDTTDPEYHKFLDALESRVKSGMSGIAPIPERGRYTGPRPFEQEEETEDEDIDLEDEEEEELGWFDKLFDSSTVPERPKAKPKGSSLRR